MQIKPKISIYLDTRSKLNSGLFPVKLRVTFQLDTRRVQKYYSCTWEDGRKIEVSQKLFNSAMKLSPTAFDAQVLQNRLKDFEGAAREVLKKNDYVSIEIFEREFVGTKSTSGVSGLFEKYIAELSSAGRIGNRTAYKTALNSIREFAGDPSFMEISVDWLNRYTTWMKTPRKIKVVVGEKEEEKVIPAKSITTIAMYLRCLRKIYNDAIFLKYVSADFYPFGKRQYAIQEVRNPKIALSEAQKNQVLAYENPETRQALDFWIFSYFCNGMNFSDIAHLKNSDIKVSYLESGEIKDAVLYFNRRKTMNTSRVLTKIEIPLRREVLDIMGRQRRPSLDPDEYLFPILERDMNPAQQKYKIQDFIDQVNKKLHIVAGKLNFNFRFTTYTARHTFANISLQKGHSKEEIQEAMGHADLKTTEGYVGGFATESKRRRGMDL